MREIVARGIEWRRTSMRFYVAITAVAAIQAVALAALAIAVREKPAFAVLMFAASVCSVLNGRFALRFRASLADQVARLERGEDIWGEPDDSRSHPSRVSK
jgi:hypothetical protein